MIVRQGREVHQTYLMCKLRDTAHGILCTRVITEGLWHELGRRLSHIGIPFQRLDVYFVVSGDCCGITERFEIHIALSFIAEAWNKLRWHTVVHVHSKKHGDKEFSSRDEGEDDNRHGWLSFFSRDTKDKDKNPFRYMWFAFLDRDTKNSDGTLNEKSIDLKHLEETLEKIKQKFNSLPHFNAVERCIRLLFENVADLGFA